MAVQDPEPLTPGHLLYGRKIVLLPYHRVEEDELDDPEICNNEESKGTSSNTQTFLDTLEIIISNNP